MINSIIVCVIIVIVCRYIFRAYIYGRKYQQMCLYVQDEIHSDMVDSISLNFLEHDLFGKILKNHNKAQVIVQRMFIDILRGEFHHNDASYRDLEDPVLCSVSFKKYESLMKHLNIIMET